MKSRKIAVCISGQIRTGVEAHGAFINFFRQCIENNDQIDVFIHTWYEPHLEDNTELLNKIKELYKPVKFEVEVSEDHSRLNYPLMFKKVMKCNELKKKHEIENDFRYDIVVRYRFDLVFPPHVHFPALPMRSRTLHHPNLNHGLNNTDNQRFGICDLIYWGDSATMDIVCDTYRYFKFHYLPEYDIYFDKKEMIDMANSLLSPGQLLYEVAIQHNIHTYECKTDSNDHIAFSPFRVEVKHLDPYHDYNKIYEFYLNQYA